MAVRGQTSCVNRVTVGGNLSRYILTLTRNTFETECASKVFTEFTIYFTCLLFRSIVCKVANDSLVRFTVKHLNLLLQIPQIKRRTAMKALFENLEKMQIQFLTFQIRFMEEKYTNPKLVRHSPPISKINLQNK